LAVYRQIGNKRGVAGALDNIANLLGDVGNPADARMRSQQVMNYAIAAARVRAATGAMSEAIKSLNATLTEAKTHGGLGSHLEARLALGETEMKSA
jgi:hypothetical protein